LTRRNRLLIMRDYKLSASARRRRVFDIIHRGAIYTCIGVTVVGMVLSGIGAYRLVRNKDEILAARRDQLEEEIAAKQAITLKALSSAETSSE